ncbi:MAG: NUDIX domain-containing protein [Bacteroidales bacterium]|nr:NUDIX domain-containing protein [Bacteroidales bacterium]
MHIFKNNRSAVTDVIINERKLLVVKRGYEPSKGMLDLPGGFVNPDENAESALKREINEELNLVIDSCSYITSHPNNYSFGGITVPCLEFFFTCTIKDISQLKAGDDAEEYYWLNIDSIDSSSFAFSSTRYFLDTILRSNEYQP